MGTYERHTEGIWRAMEGIWSHTPISRRRLIFPLPRRNNLQKKGFKDSRRRIRDWVRFRFRVRVRDRVSDRVRVRVLREYLNLHGSSVRRVKYGKTENLTLTLTLTLTLLRGSTS